MSCTITEVLAPNGEPSKLYSDLYKEIGNEFMAMNIYLKTKTPQFKKWFGDSKVVDKNGEPLIVTHGSDNDFSIFDSVRGHYFSVGLESGWIPEKSNRYPVFLRIENPVYKDPDYYAAKNTVKMFPNNDGVIGWPEDTGHAENAGELIVHDSSQIKSIFSQGFQIDDPSIFAMAKVKDPGDYTRVLASKNAFLNRRRKELNNLRREEREITSLAKKRIIRKKIEGVKEDITQLEADIKILDREKDLYTLYNDIFPKDMKRVLAYLEIAESNQYDFDAITEALNIIELYKKIGNLEDIYGHPIFSPEEIKSMSQEDRMMLSDMADQMIEYKVDLQELLRSRLTKYINTNKTIQKKLKGELKYEDLVKPLEDIDKFTREFLNVSKGGLVKGEQSILGEIMFYLMAKANEEATSEIRLKNEVIDDLVKEVIPELNSLGYSGSKTFDLFFQKVGDKETGNLVYNVGQNFYDTRRTSLSKINSDIYKLRTTLYGQRGKGRKGTQAKIDSLVNKRNEWIRQNEIVFDIRKLDEVWDAMDPDLAKEFSGFRIDDDGAHKQEIIDAAGTKLYNKLLKEQIEDVQRYLVNRAIEFERIDSDPKLNEKTRLKWEWQKQNSPFHSAQAFYEVVDTKGVNGYHYLGRVPRAKKVNIKLVNRKYQITSTEEDTGYYDENFKRIEANPTLSKFYYHILETLENLHAALPPDVKRNFQFNSLPLFKQLFSELLLDANLPALMLGGSRVWENLLEIATDRENYETSYDVIDPVTNQTDYRFNYRNIGVKQRTSSVKREIDRLIAAHVAEHGEAPTEKDLREIELTAKNTVANTSTHDLGTIIKLFTAYVTMAKHKEKVLPTLNIMRQEFEAIRSKRTTNIFGVGRLTTVGDEAVIADSRENAVKQMQNQLDFFVGNPLNYVELPINTKDKILTPEEKRTAKRINDTIDKLGLDETITNLDEDGLQDHLEKIKAKHKNSRDIDERKDLNTHIIKIEALITLRKHLRDLGGYLTVSGVGDVMLRGIQLKGMGWNLAAAPVNSMAGLISNLTQAADGRKVTMEGYMYGLKQMFFSALKTLSGNKINIGTAEKSRVLMDRYNIMQDASNELYKATVGNLSGKFDALHPYNIVRRTEYVNQTPLMIDNLKMKQFITDKNGKKSSVWDAMDDKGMLKEEFRTKKNIDNWENVIGSEVTDFKLYMEELIRETHGDYSNISRMRAKKTLLLRAATQFKTWLPEAIYLRFGKEKGINSLTGITTKGRYRSFTPGSGALHGAIIGTTLAPGLGTAIGFLLGKYLSPNKQDGVSFGDDLMFSTKQLLRKVFYQGTQYGDRFNEVDAANLRANMMELHVILSLFLLYFLTKMVLFDDDDERKDVRRIAHNIMINNILRFQSDIQLYTSPVEWSNFANNIIPAMKTVDDIGKFINAASETVIGEGIYERGINAGESKLWNATKRLIPTIYGLQIAPDYMIDRTYDEPVLIETIIEE